MTGAVRATLVVRGIGALVTCDPALGHAPGVVADAVLAADGDRIVYAGPAAGAPDCAGAEELDAAGGAVLPGFVDSHTHAVWLGERSDEYARRAGGATYEEIAAEGGGIAATVRATAAGSVDELVASALPRLRRMLAGGTTTVEIKSGYGLDGDAELRQLEAAAVLGRGAGVPAVVATYLPLHAAPPGDRAAFLTRVVEHDLPRCAPHARCVDAFCEQGAYTVGECDALLTAAAGYALRAKLHAEQRGHSGAAALAARHRAVSADHLEHASDGDLRALAAAGTTAVLLPGASLVLGGPSPPGRRALDAGCTVAIATDCNPGTCWSESMPLMMSLGVAIAGLTPAEAVVAATRGGAAALGLGDRGVLRAGMRCDAVVLRTPRWIDVAYHLGGDEIAAVVAGGRVAP